MEFRKVLALRGPNPWALFPVLEAWVDLGVVMETHPEGPPGFMERLTARLPTSIEHRRGGGPRGDCIDGDRGGIGLAHALECATRALQARVGTPVEFGRTQATAEPGVFRVAVAYEEEALARACLETARALCLAAVHDRPFDAGAEVGRLRRLAGKVCLGPSTAAIVAAARARGIPARRLNSESLVQLGHGARRRRIVAAETDCTGAIAEQIAQDKELTRSLLHAVGVPVPEGRPVADADDAWEAAREIGGPVVVKPRDGNHGRGVAADLRTREQVLAAYAAAAHEGSGVLVERFAPGADHRLLVVGGRVVAAARREPPQVIGDGRRTIAALVEEANRDPRRSDGHATALSTIPLDATSLAVLADQGLTPESIPSAGTPVLVRRNANLSTGGTSADVTDRVHPAVAARAVTAARMVGLDVAGIDLVTPDIGLPLEEQGGVVIEVNAGPGLRMHLEPSEGRPRPVGEAIVESLFPGQEAGRIPLVGVTGVNGKTTVTRLIAHILKQAGRRVGMTCTDGIYVDGRRIEAGDCSGPQSAGAILMNPEVDAAVLETARGGILRAGLAFDRCDVAVVTNIGEGDHLGLGGVETLEELARVKRVLVEAVAADGVAVLKADDPLVAAMAPHCRGSVVFFTRDADHPVLAAHRGRGGRGAFIRDGVLVLEDGLCADPLLPLEHIPLTYAGRVGFQVENALAAAAACWALGVPREAARAGLKTFVGDTGQAPGRFNVLKADGATVIVDFGHNPSAIAALVEAIDLFPHPRRTIAVTGTGDRRDEDIIHLGGLIGGAFDRVVLFEDCNRRGRPDGEMIALLRQGLARGSRVSEVVATRGEAAAIALALQGLRAESLTVILADDSVERCLALVRGHLAPASDRHANNSQELAPGTSDPGPSTLPDNSPIVLQR
jgi:cyanophycin synthetase